MRALYVPEAICPRIPDAAGRFRRQLRAARAFYTPSAEGGLAYDDPRLGLDWPLPVTALSARDRSFQPLAVIEDELRRRMLPELASRAENVSLSI